MKTTAFLAAMAFGASATALAHEKDWNFGDGETPERWGSISTDYAACDIGKMQSPIDLTDPDAIGTVALATNLGQASGTLSVGEEKV